MLLLMSSADAAPQSKKQKDSVILAPVSSLGDKKQNKTRRQVSQHLLNGLRSFSGLNVVSVDKRNKAIRQKWLECEAEPSCLGALGMQQKVNHVIAAELGGLGGAQVVYLRLIDTITGKEIRTSTLAFVSNAPDIQSKSVAALTQLLTPKNYKGTLHLTVNIANSSLYVDGQKRRLQVPNLFPLEVGTHALRVTHPEHRDFVRFIEISFQKQTNLDVKLNPLPGISGRLSRNGSQAINPLRPLGQGNKVNKATPWYYRWYTIGGGVALIAVGSAIWIASTTGGVDYDIVRDL